MLIWNNVADPELMLIIKLKTAIRKGYVTMTKEDYMNMSIFDVMAMDIIDQEAEEYARRVKWKL